MGTKEITAELEILTKHGMLIHVDSYVSYGKKYKIH